MILFLKLTLVPSLIALLTLAGRLWGPRAAGFLSALPVISGPILFVLTLTHGPGFAAAAAQGTLSAVLAVLAFGLAYAWAALRRPWFSALTAGFAAYGMAVLTLSLAAPAPILSATLIFPLLLGVPRLYPRRLPAPAPAMGALPHEIPVRMAASCLLVVLVTGAAERLGPRLSGIFAMFPIISCVLVAFSHRQYGPAFAITLLRGSVFGYFAFAGFCIALAATLPYGHVAGAFTLSIAVALIVQTAIGLAAKP